MVDRPVTLAALPEDECWRLLTVHEPRLGRIAFTAGRGPVIYPMNYAVAERTVYLRTEPDSRLAAALTAQQVAFEVDEVDGRWEDGWSVLVQGRLREVDDPEELMEHRSLRLRAWAPGERLHLLRLDASHISGRRIA